MKNRLLAAGCAAIFAACISAPPALAIPGGGGSDPTKTDTSKTQPAPKSAKQLKCKRGQTAKLVKYHGKKRWRCVTLKAEILSDEGLYQQARLLAAAGEYEWALDHLRLIKNQNDPEVLNYTGYSNRKAGRLETGIGYYYKALAIDPNYVEAREYLGEAYVLAGRLDLAKAQLQEIQTRRGTNNKAFEALQKAIAGTDL